MAAARNHQGVLKQPFSIFSPGGGGGGADREGLSSRSMPPCEDQYFEESDVVWNCNYLQPPETRSPEVKSRPRATSKTSDRSSASSTTKSVPVNVPDWSKILLHEYRSCHSCCSSSSYDDHMIEEEEEEVDVARLPPHEMVMRRWGPPPSVVKGVGRTLKGRDMRRVRNAIWAQTGFQD